MAQFITTIRTDLDSPLGQYTIGGKMFTQDNKANRINVELYKNKLKVNAEGEITGIVKRNDGKAVAFSGGIENGNAYVVLPETAYAIEGPIDILVRETIGDAKTVIAVCKAYVTKSADADYVTAGSTVVSIEELAEALDRLDPLIERMQAVNVETLSDFTSKIEDVDDALTRANSIAENSFVASVEGTTLCFDPVDTSSTAWATVGAPEDEQVQAAVSDWLDENVTGEGSVVVDDTLSISGAAADAKVTGDELTSLKSAIDNGIGNLLTVSAWTTNKGLMKETGDLGNITGGTSKVSDYIDISGYRSLLFSAKGNSNAAVNTATACFYDSEQTFIHSVDHPVNSGVPEIIYAEIPSTAKYVRFAYFVSTTLDFFCFAEYAKTETEQEVDTILGVPKHQELSWTNAKIVKMDGDISLSTTTFNASSYLDVSGFTSIWFTAMYRTVTETATACIAFYDSEKQFINGSARQYLGYDADELVMTEISIPNGAYYARFSMWNSNDKGYFRCYCVKNSGRIDTAEQDIIRNSDRISVLEKTSAAVNGTNFADSLTWNDGKIVNYITGEIAANTVPAYKSTDPVDVSSYNSIEFMAIARQGDAATSSTTLAFYDENLQYIHGVRFVGEATTHAVKCKCQVPKDAKYARFTYFTDASYPEFYCYGNKKLDVVNSTFPNHIRFMVFGNSYGCDSIGYVPFILKNMGITSEIYLYVRDACSLRDIYNRWESDAAFDTETDGVHAGTYQRNVFYIDTRFCNAWVAKTRESMKAVVSKGNWDFITLQQYSVYSLDPETYEPWTSLDIDLIRQQVGRGTPIAYTHVYTRHSADNPTESIATFKDYVYPNEPFDFFIPLGTTIFSLRTNSTFADMGASQYKNMWCDDSIHLQEGLPKYAAAITIAEAICRKFFPQRSVLFDRTEITDAIITSWNVPEPHTPVVGMTDANRLVAQRTAIMSNNFPFVIQQVGNLPKETYTSYSDFPGTGVKGVLYVDETTNKSYTWDGSQYVENVAT